jgi:hypothetical protein
VSLLHWLASLAFSAQLRALAALWRLFRGRKLNPLRYRVDSFECTVEQVVVGSLLFTLLLLLLPTTWAYYSLCVMAYSGIVAARVALQLGGAAVRAFPFYSLAVWAVMPGAFPVAVSFQVTSQGQVLGAGKGSSEPADSQSDRRRILDSDCCHVIGTGSLSLPRSAKTTMLKGLGKAELSVADKGAGERTKHKSKLNQRSCSEVEHSFEKQAGMGDSSRVWEDEGEAIREQAAMILPACERPQEQAGAGCIPGLRHVPPEEELIRRHLRLEMVTADAGERGRSQWCCTFFVPPGLSSCD